MSTDRRRDWFLGSFIANKRLNFQPLISLSIACGQEEGIDHPMRSRAKNKAANYLGWRLLCLWWHVAWLLHKPDRLLANNRTTYLLPTVTLHDSWRIGKIMLY